MFLKCGHFVNTSRQSNIPTREELVFDCTIYDQVNNIM